MLKVWFSDDCMNEDLIEALTVIMKGAPTRDD
jgi:hypothetical protein